MNTRTLLAITLTATAGLTGGQQALADDYGKFLEKYAKYHQAATRHLWWNVKVSGTRTRSDHYADMPPTALTEDQFTVVADSSTLIFQMTAFGRGQYSGRIDKFGQLLNNDALYGISYKKGVPSLSDSLLILPWDQKTHAYYYGVYTSPYAPLDYPLFRLYIGRGPNRYYRPNPNEETAGEISASGSTFSVRNETRNGIDCIAVRMESPKRDLPRDYIYYLDPRNYLVVARETRGIHQMKTRRIEPIRQVVEISYGPPAADTGLPFPTAIKTNFHTPDGKTYPGDSVTFTEYRRYTPTPDELDVEKVLKVKMPTIPPRPPLPPEGQYLVPELQRFGELLPAVRGSGRSAWWWYAGAAVLLAVAIAAGLIVRRRRRAGM